MKKRILVLICLLTVAVLTLAGCTIGGDDSQLRKEGYNIVVVFDCGRYENQAKTAHEDAAVIEYGNVSLDEESAYNRGIMENYQVREYYFNVENGYIPEPGKSTQSIPSPQLRSRVFVGWYVASVVAYKLDDNGNPIKNSVGQYEYGGVVPQESDQLWDFSATYGSYESHPAAATKFVYDATKPLDAMVEVGGQTVTNCTTHTDEELSYNKDDGFYVYLYAKWNVQKEFVIEAQGANGEWSEVLRANPNASGKLADKSSELNKQKEGYTFYNLYTDKACTQLWDSNTKFETAYTGTEDSLQPYVILYAKYIQGEWNVVRTAGQLVSALIGNKNVYLDNNLTISGSNWSEIKEYSAEFNGNNYVITFDGEYVPKVNKDTSNFALIGAFSGKMQNVTFENVQVRLSSYPVLTTIYCGVFVGRVVAGATFTNVKVSGKITYSDTIVQSAENGNLTLYSGGELGCNVSWYGMKVDSVNVSGVDFTNIDVAE